MVLQYQKKLTDYKFPSAILLIVLFPCFLSSPGKKRVLSEDSSYKTSKSSKLDDVSSKHLLKCFMIVEL